MKRLLMVISILFLFTLSACSKKELIVVTTTSLENSGLLEYIIPHFEDEYGIFVKVVALGTGAALEMGEMGEADILLVHAYDSEVEFVENGYGEKRNNIMYNDFIIVGPLDLDAETLEEALELIVGNLDFYSRGDNSGTHTKELSIWEQYDYDVSGFNDWYKETGQSMGSTLTMTSLSGYYTLSD
ncbi:MAG: substrate-binding domain-containing protein, partial [Candidatus Izimaplasma sp.]|nr:substrate-binding domain-containing protein [Candidatus Izimaplasma bacterium]